jgi:hypothetical protein
MRITLSEEDATRLECPRELEFDPNRIMGSDLIALEEQLGWSFEQLEEAMLGEPAKNAIGEPIWETDAKGKIVLDAKGKPQPLRTLKSRTLIAVTWLCVRRANPAVRWEGFDFAVTATKFDDDPPAGKAPSPTNTTTGKPRSARSSATRRGSSAKS